MAFLIIHDTLDGNSFLRSMDHMDITADNCPWTHPEAFLIRLNSTSTINVCHPARTRDTDFSSSVLYAMCTTYTRIAIFSPPIHVHITNLGMYMFDLPPFSECDSMYYDFELLGTSAR
ncbi:uncharacterized protein EAF01_006496 [Botrytis porri]|uniref:uncharacterized protein n=1 Tax=Botrytis porri TaxID=87229 RepID=UPI0018FF578F|nr:uncharacterized protein EAF01_006496 [Botrytis porri]KAF7903447.1 hypothetical protein EAF01_006496 [Botrytis porri]